MKEVIVKLTSDHIKVKGAEYVRDLVRCRDCKYLEIHGKTTMYYWCDQWEHYTDEDSFCANSFELKCRVEQLERKESE